MAEGGRVAASRRHGEPRMGGDIEEKATHLVWSTVREKEGDSTLR